MNIVTELTAFVLANPGLAALQSGRIYPVQLPQAATLPASTYMIVSDVPAYSQDGLSSQTPRIQIDCYATTYLAVHALADAYVAAIPSWKDRFGAPAFLASGPYDLPDDPDLARSRVSLDITIGG